jgi:hypothetical protein
LLKRIAHGGNRLRAIVAGLLVVGVMVIAPIGASASWAYVTGQVPEIGTTVHYTITHCLPSWAHGPQMAMKSWPDNATVYVGINYNGLDQNQITFAYNDWGVKTLGYLNPGNCYKFIAHMGFDWLDSWDNEVWGATYTG